VFGLWSVGQIKWNKLFWIFFTKSKKKQMPKSLAFSIGIGVGLACVAIYVFVFSGLKTNKSNTCSRICKTLWQPLGNA